MHKRILHFCTCALFLISACGGSGDPPVELTFDSSLQVFGSTVILSGKSFVPEGSTCPGNGELVRFGSLGAHQITWHNAATGSTGLASAIPWVCNSEDGRVTSWRSIAPVSLAPGENVITVTMSSTTRTSSASIALSPRS